MLTISSRRCLGVEVFSKTSDQLDGKSAVESNAGHLVIFTDKGRICGFTTDIDVVRDGKNLKGCVLGLVLGTIGKGVLEKAFKNSVKAIEERNGSPKVPAAS